MSESQAPYSLSIDLNVLKHLGIKLYSNVAAALTEVVANAWDADAENVWISISDDNCSVSILDDGHGMNSDDLNKKYLRVGYERREQNEARSPKGRPVMGRKGLGKLALFSIANSITVQSVRDSEKNGFVMTLSGIENAIKSPDGIQLYKPKKINEDELTIDIEHGTLISLDDIKSKKIALTITAMKKILARRFSVIGNSDSFKVYVNNSAIVMADKEDRRVVQLAWVFGNDSSSEAFPSAVEKYVLSDRDESWSPEWKVTGWLGTAAVPKDLNHDDLGNINTIVVMARGRVFQENILDKIPENRIYARYLTGVIQADFLDEDDEDDIATSDRQRIQEDDPRFRALVAFVKKSMQAIEKTWSEKRKQIQGEKAVANHPALDLWINSLGESHKAQARKMINTVASLHMTEDDEDSRKEIYKSAILAFERLKLRGGVEEFNEALQKGTDEFLKVISNFDDYEISLYRDLINNRLNGIQILEKMVDNGSWENHIRDFIFDRLWLIDPSWERAINSEIKETTIHKQFEKGLSSDLTSDEERGRVDIAYRNITQGHIIVELKKPSVKKDIMELVQQGRKYKTTLVKCLKAAGENHDDIKIVFILGEALDDILDRDFIQAQLLSINARVVTYGEIIIKARSSYSEFIEKSKEKDRIRAVVDSL